MLRLVLAVLLLIVALGFFVATRKNGTPATKATATATLAASVVLGGLLVLWACAYKVDQGEAVVLRNINGDLSSNAEPGFAFKSPLEKVIRFDVKNQTIDLYGPCDGKHQDGAEDCQITTNTNDNADVFMSSTTNYSLDPSRIEQIYKTYRSQDNLIERDLLPGIRSSQRDAPTTFPAATIRQSRAAVATTVLSDLETRLKGTGVIITRVDLRSINLDAESAKRLRNVQLRNADIEAARQDLEKSRINAEKTKTEAKAQSDADQIQRCGATITEATQVINGKETTVKVVEPKPNEECQNRLNEQVLTSKYIDMLRAAAEGGNTVYVVPQGANNLLNLTAAK